MASLFLFHINVILDVFFYWGFSRPKPTTNIFARMQKYWTKKSFFSASKAISHIPSYHSWFGLIASTNISKLDALSLFLIWYAARPTFPAALLLAGSYSYFIFFLNINIPTPTIKNPRKNRCEVLNRPWNSSWESALRYSRKNLMKL